MLQAWLSKFLAGTGSIYGPALGVRATKHLLENQPRTLMLTGLQKLWQDPEALTAFLSGPTPENLGITNRFFNMINGSSVFPFTAVVAMLTSEDAWERTPRQRLGLYEPPQLEAPPPLEAPPQLESPPQPVPQVSAAPPPQPVNTMMSQASPSVAPPPNPGQQQQRARYAAMFPFDPASDILRQRQAQAPAQRGIGSLV